MCMFVFGLIGGFIAQAITGVPAIEVAQAIEKEDASAGAVLSFKIMQLFASFGGFVVSSYLFLRFFRIDLGNHLGLKERVPFKNFLLVILLGIAMLPLISLLQELNQDWNLSGVWDEAQKNFEESQKAQEGIYEKFLRADDFVSLLFNLLLIAVVPALGEELFFRGVLFPVFWGWTKNKHVGILLSALLFSVIHFQFFNFLPIIFMGVLFGYLYVWSGSLKLPITAHFTNNAMVVLMSYWSQHGGPEYLRTDYTFSWWWAIPSALISAFIAWIFYRWYQQRNAHEQGMD